jgi:ribosomal protein S27E
MAKTSKCPACGEAISLSDDAAQSRFTCPACGIGLATSEDGELMVEAIRPATTSNLANVPKPPPKLDDAEDERDEDIPRRRPWRRKYNHAAALQKVKVPAAILQGYGALWILAGLAIVAIFAIGLARKPPAWGDFAFAALGLVFCVPVGIVTFLAGARLRQFRAYVFVMANVITHIVLAFIICIPAAIVTIWPLAALLNSDVKAAFDENKEHELKGARAIRSGVNEESTQQRGSAGASPSHPQD